MSGNPVYSPFFGAMGASAAMIFSGECGRGRKRRAVLGRAFASVTVGHKHFGAPRGPAAAVQVQAGVAEAGRVWG